MVLSYTHPLTVFRPELWTVGSDICLSGNQGFIFIYLIFINSVESPLNIYLNIFAFFIVLPEKIGPPLSPRYTLTLQHHTIYGRFFLSFFLNSIF